MKIPKQFIEFISLLLTLFLLLTSCSSIYEHMPDTTENDGEIDLSEEYFTTGQVVCGSSANLGVIYEGQWVYVESTQIEVDGIKQNVAERLVKYNPVTDTVSSLCLNPNCFHSNEECMLCAPYAWIVAYFEIFGDWIMYTYRSVMRPDKEIDTQRTYLYNLKTGESRQLYARTKEGEVLTSQTGNFVMNGKIYTAVLEMDYTGQEEYNSNPHDTPFMPETRQYIEEYDPQTQKFERLFEVPNADYLLVGLTNKRFFFKDSVEITWSTDYQGKNLSEETNMPFDFWMVCDKYVYLAESPDYSKEGYNFRGYDLETDSLFIIDFGCQIRSALVDSRRLCFTTMSNIDEYKEFAKNTTAYVKNLYPDVIDPEKLAQMKTQVRNQLQYGGSFQIFVTDAMGENKQLVFEKDHVNFIPFRISGNYIFGTISYGDPNNNYQRIETDGEGRCALNLETGEITLIPQLEFYSDLQQ